MSAMFSSLDVGDRVKFTLGDETAIKIVVKISADHISIEPDAPAGFMRHFLKRDGVSVRGRNSGGYIEPVGTSITVACYWCGADHPKGDECTN